MSEMDLEHLRGSHILEQFIDGLGEVKKEIEHVGFTLEHAAKKIDVQNGRIGKIETKVQAIETQHLLDKAWKDGADTALITKTQWKVIMGLLAAVTVVSSLISSVVALALRFNT